ncbi:MAG TPA: glucose-1-phosphate adenylyltransferase [Ramlibacter sp.]|nr:glucose-1-phosphate adenylyltransferase [Ramlibacter sp.]
MSNVLAVVLAGGEGTRLKPLTAQRCKPAVGFHGRHRVVDFVLSNLANSGICSIWMLVQYEPRQLIEHVARAWPARQSTGEPSIRVVAAQESEGGRGFRGTADAVFQNIERIEAERPDIVAIFSADHIYRMDVRQMLAFHRAKGADVTVATLPVPLHECRHFGIAQTDAHRRITGFAEKPLAARPLPGSRTHALASMGNYIVETGVLLQQLRRMHDSGGTDFGQHLLPALVKTHKVMAYDFTTNVVPGVAGTEERAYWRDVGTLDAWFDAQFDAVGLHPRFGLTNPEWPIHTSADPAGPALVEGGAVRHSVLGSGSVVDGARVERTILRSGVHVQAGARLENCVVMDGSRIRQGACVQGAIIGEDNDVPPAEFIGMDMARDRNRFMVTSRGIVVVPAGYFPRAEDRPPPGRMQRLAPPAGIAVAKFARPLSPGFAPSPSVKPSEGIDLPPSQAA